MRIVTHDSETNPADLVVAGVERTLELAATWLDWDGRGRLSEGGDRLYTPNKAIRRHSDHLVDHLAEVHALLAGVPTKPDRWLASAVTLESDWAPFGPAELNEAGQRLRRLARTYQVVYQAAGPAEWDRPREPSWTLRRIAAHVGSSWYAEQVGDLPAADPIGRGAGRTGGPHVMEDPRREAAELIFREWDRRARDRDVEGLLEFYCEDATLESPLVPRILDQPAGVVAGKEQLRRFFVEGGRRRPDDADRWHRSGTFLYDGTTLVWEYPRATPDGDQVDIAEVMELRDGRIAAHRIYWGWSGTERLIANAVAEAATGG